MLMRSAAQSLTEQLAERFAARIRDRLLAPGSRLPSVRQCARLHTRCQSKACQPTAQAACDGAQQAHLFTAASRRSSCWTRSVCMLRYSSASSASLAKAMVSL